MLTDQDIAQIKQRGSDLEEVKKQLKQFKEGFPAIKLIKPATVSDGIIQLSDAEVDEQATFYEDNLGDRTVCKFVPASGAASRMFKALFQFMESYDGSDAAYGELTGKGDDHPVFVFFKNIENFAFYEDLKSVLEKDGIHLEEALLKREYKTILTYLLTEKGLNYGNLPKGLLKFHDYDAKENRTPVEEHLVEGAHYAVDKDKQVKVHFTVSPEHQELFESLVKEKSSQYENAFDVHYQVSYSQQDPSTDTIAVDVKNQPFRLENDEILFRPGGHGALLKNLNAIDADLIFIKNIDNVVPDGLKETTYVYKKALAGVLLHYQQKIFYYLEELSKSGVLDMKLSEELADLLEEDLCILPASKAENREEAKYYYFNKLNRPIRVCGMVRNEGEPGGGPFWTRGSDYATSLQIVEAAQVDTENQAQKRIAGEATHFNPVDVVCSIKDFRGETFDLSKFVDWDTGFISKKSVNGRELRALELPGLWNGSMADWITLFVEVPKITFNPVKTVNDLLRPEHVQGAEVN